MASNNIKYHSEYTKYMFAQIAIFECSEYLSLYKSGYNGNRHVKASFERAVSKAFIITYAKSFLSSNKGTKDGFGGGGISTKWLSFCEPEIRETHKQIVELSRHFWVAHTNLKKLEPKVKLSGCQSTIISSSQEHYLKELGYSDLSKLLNACENSIMVKMDSLKEYIGDCEFKL